MKMKLNIDIDDWQTREMIALEAFIRRVSKVNQPFMLKGSLVTRQYMQNPLERTVADVDLVYMEKIEEVDEANEIFSTFLTEVTEIEEDDGIIFSSFSENSFFRRIDYAMSDDFPTVNTDLEYIIGSKSDISNDSWENQNCECLSLDISFNLNIEVPPVPLLYKPMYDEPFNILYTAPLSLQIAWKLHQTVVRPRVKDILDLIVLLQHPSFDEISLNDALQAFINECNMDKIIKPNMIKKVLTGDLLSEYDSLKNDYDWKNLLGSKNSTTDFSFLIQNFAKALQNAGINEQIINKLLTQSKKIT